MNILQAILADCQNANCQLLSEAMTGVDTSKKGITTVSFITKEITANDVYDNTGKIGVVVWLDRSNVKKLIEQEKN